MSLQRNDNANVLERIRRGNACLDGLMRLYTNDKVSSTEFARYVTKEAGKQLGAQRVSAWSLSEENDRIDCIDLYLSAEENHQACVSLYVNDFPRYFEAVLAERVIAANDASLDPRTSEFTDVYLKPNRIISMLDAQIRSAAGPRGVVCIETVDVRREWSPDEIAFAMSVAELLGFSMDREDRRLVHSQLEDANARLATAVATAEEAHERYDLAIKAAVDGVWDFDLSNGEVYYSEQNFKLLGMASGSHPSTLDWWRERLHPDDGDWVLKAFESHKDHNTPYDVTYRIEHVDGSWRWWRSRGKAIRDADDIPVRVVGTNSDVTSLVQTQDELERRNQQLVLAKQKVEDSALHDALTGLPNRRYMDQICNDMLQNAWDAGQIVSFLHIDLDHFKEINDKFGHAAGDAILKRVATALDRLSHDGEFVARIGGDEFVAILFETEDAKRSTTFSNQLIMLLDEPMISGDGAFGTGASIGIALSDATFKDGGRLLGNADLALYEAKKLGRNRFDIFDEEMRVKAAFIRDTKEEIHASLTEGSGFVPYFQPQFYAGTLNLAGAEVLARWEHPTRGRLAPDQFLEFATEMNCVAEIDRQILTKSMSFVRAWREQDLFLPRLAVNVSSKRLNHPQLISSVEALGDDARILSFELLESTFLDDTSEQVSNILARLRALGVEIEIDDFGSGYASIQSLLNIRPTRLKIDRSLTRGVDSDEAMFRLVQSVVDIARILDIEVVAEGVETPNQIETLTEIGCDMLQGFGLAMPMSETDFFSKFSNGALKLGAVAG